METLNLEVGVSGKLMRIPRPDEENHPPNRIPDYDTLVLSGGSIKGIVMLGGLQYVYENYYLKHIKTYIGTSVGSMICYLLCIGYTPIEILVYISTHSEIFDKLQNLDIVNMYNGLGATSFIIIQDILEKMTISKIGRLITLQDLYDQFDKKLICTTYNDTDSCIEYLSYENKPNLPCLIALRMSSNLPEVFEDFMYENKQYVDGGLGDNFPIQLGEEKGDRILGFLVSKKNKARVKEDEHFLERVYRRAFIAISQSIEYKISQISDKCTIIRFNYPSVKFFNFNLSASDRMNMFSRGYQTSKEHFEGK
jgi:NTE family protein